MWRLSHNWRPPFATLEKTHLIIYIINARKCGRKHTARVKNYLIKKK